MTVALTGKSRGRRAALVGVAIFAIIVSLVWWGAELTGDAHAVLLTLPESAPVGTCSDLEGAADPDTQRAICLQGQYVEVAFDTTGVPLHATDISFRVVVEGRSHAGINQPATVSLRTDAKTAPLTHTATFGSTSTDVVFNIPDRDVEQCYGFGTTWSRSELAGLTVRALATSSSGVRIDDISLTLCYGHRTITSVSLVGSNDTIEPGELVELRVTATTHGSDTGLPMEANDWACTRYAFSGSPGINWNHAVATTNVTNLQRTTQVTAPGFAGTYDLVVTAFSDVACTLRPSNPYVVAGVQIGAQLLPDLRVSKSAVRDGVPVTAIADNEDFRWRWVIENSGEGEAAFTPGQVVLRDELPPGLAYTDPASSSAELTCGVSVGVLTCTANSALTIGPQGSLSASVLATPQSAGTYTNTPAGCQVDYLAGNAAGNVAESDETNNTCAQAVAVDVLPRFQPRVCVRLEDNGDAVPGETATFQVVVTNLDTGSIVNILNAPRVETASQDPINASECADLSLFVAGTALRITQTVVSPPGFSPAPGYPVVNIIPGVDPAVAVSQVDIVVGDGHCGGDTAGESVIANGTCNVHILNRTAPAIPAVVLPTVRKEPHHEPVSAGVARWTITIDQPAENWGVQTVTVTDAHADVELADTPDACSIAGGVITCEVGESDLTVTVTRAVFEENLSSGTLCGGGTIANHLIAAALADGTALEVTAGMEPVDIEVRDTAACAPPTVVKRLQDDKSEVVETADDVAWVIVVSNPEDGLDGAVVTLRDDGAALHAATTVPPGNFGSWCEVDESDQLKVACELPAGAHVMLTVRPGLMPQLQCAAAEYSNTVEYRIRDGSWLEAHGPDITLTGTESECPRDVMVVKRLVNVPGSREIDPGRDLPTLDVPDGQLVSGPTDLGNGAWEWTYNVPAHYSGEITETVPPGWEAVACEPEPGAFATFCNQPLATIAARKVYMPNGGADATDEDSPLSILLEGHGAFLPDGATTGNVTDYLPKDVPAGRYTVTESLRAGWRVHSITVTGDGCFEVVPTDLFDALEQTLVLASRLLKLEIALTFDAEPGAECLVTFTNERLVATVVIEKVYLGAAGDEPTIDIAVDGIEVAAMWTKAGDPATEWRQTVAVSGSGSVVEVTETLPAGWANVAALSGSCGGVDTSGMPVEGAIVSVVLEGVAPGDEATVCLVNIAVGRVQLVKVESLQPGSARRWSFASDAHGVGGTLQTPGGESVSQAQASFERVPVGEYSIFEAEGRGACQPGALASDFQTWATSKTGVPPADSEMTDIVGAAPIPFVVEKGETTYIRFDNQGCGTVLGTGTIVVWKFADFDGDGVRDTGEPPLADWPFTISGPDGTFEVATDADGKHVFTVAQGGIYTVTEAARPGWKVIGSRQGASFAPGPAAQVTAGLGQHREVAFFNQPRVGIRVAKTEVSSAFSAGRPGADWEFTLSGCAIAPRTGVTGDQGDLVFDDLPPAIGCAYTVTETSRDGWFALWVSREAAPTSAGEFITVQFRNTLLEECGACVQPPVPAAPGSSSPAPASTPAPAAPVPPTATPTTSPGQAPSTPGASTTAVAGDRTPGPSPTPLPPATGFGPTRQGSPLLLVLIGSVAVATGLMFIRAGRGR